MNTLTLNDTTVGQMTWDDSTKTPEFAPIPVIPDEFNLGASGLSQVYKELNSLCAAAQEEGYKPPSEDALDRVIDILQKTAYSFMQTTRNSDQTNAVFPVGFVTTDDEGGVRIEWWHNRKFCVHLVVGSSQNAKQYVFVKLHENKDGSVNHRIYPSHLADQLQRLNELRIQRAE